jgi:hypothetical protein
MHFLRCVMLLLALLICLSPVAGCGGGNEKPVNRDLDRPKPPK